MWIEVGKAADLKVLWIVEGAPEFFTPAIENREAVGIVDRGAEVVDLGPIVWSEEEHAGHRRKAGVFEVHPRINRHLHIEHGGVAGPYGEAIGGGRAFAVQQGVDHDGGGVRAGLLDPERLEEREFLALGLPGVDRKSAG